MKNTSIGFQINQTSHQIKSYVGACIREQSDIVLSPSEGMMLRYIYEKQDEGVVSAKLLIQRFHVSKATASELLSDLIRKGLITYAPVKSDGRVKQILLTQEGQKIQETVDAILSRCDEAIMSGFSKAEKQELLRLLAKVQQNVGKGEGDGEQESKGR